MYEFLGDLSLLGAAAGLPGIGEVISLQANVPFFLCSLMFFKVYVSCLLSRLTTDSKT